jgi:HAD superfamily hydrolase (TIGR01459 family)
MKDLSTRYPVWFCDIWGVVHNGVTPYQPACNALTEHRRNGGVVILVTNAPRVSKDVIRHLTHLGVPRESYDHVVTSGDATRTLLTDHARKKAYYIGPPYDTSLFEGLDVAQVALAEAHAALCVGLVDDAVESPDDYAELLADMKSLQLPMICANPDKIVRKGDRLQFCAGALAEKYAGMGGQVLMAGKPFPPIYELARFKASELSGHDIPVSDILAIGDGPETDIKGAADNGFDVVLIADGVTDASLGLEATHNRIQAQVPRAKIIRTMHQLAWG